MKINTDIYRSITPTSLGLPLLFAIALLVKPGSAAPPAGEAKAEPKTYTLFMGADFAVQQNKDFYRVLDVDGGSFVIKVNGEQVFVPMDKQAVSLKIDQSLKLTEASVAVTNLKSDRVYTPGNDPRRKWAAASSMPDDLGMAANSMQVAQQDVVAIPRAMAASGAPGPVVAGATEYLTTRSNEATQNYNRASAAALSNSDMNNAGRNAATMEEELAKGLFDAVEVNFEVSAERPLASPYVVIVAQYHERDTPPGTLHNWIYAKALEPVDRTPRKVRIMQGGFPPGFELGKLQVHLYDHGRELATNVADKRVPLTRDEAFQYMVIDHITSHKGANVPATPAMAKLPADLRSRLPGGQFEQMFFVKVGKDGLPVEAYLDRPCQDKVEDPYLQTVIRDIRFKPALENGRPVEGVALLKFSDLRL
ncbi:MAG: hypothetical protein WC485_02120 [Opitutaceae bacterium]